MDDEKVLKEYMKIALSANDILELLDGEANIITYPELHNYSSIEEMLYPYNACVILYMTKHNFGHWCCLFRIGNTNTIEFFDPYGVFVDDQLKRIPENFRKVSNQMYPLLSLLLYNSPFNLTYNEHKFQRLSKDIQTCGRWVALRILYKDLSLNEFKKLFKNSKSDELATLLTI